MIPRYSREKMTEIWSDQNRFQKWLDVELAACEAQAELGAIPQKAMAKIREGVSFDLEAIRKKEEETHHEVVAFLNVVQKNVGKDSRFIHMGLTSSDVMDTATSLQMVEALDEIEKETVEIRSTIRHLAEKYKYTPIIGRTHGIHAEPTTFGLKLIIYYDEFTRHIDRIKSLRKRIEVGKISGAVGNYAQIDPEVERIALEKLGLTPAPVSNQILQRDRHAEFVFVLALIAASCEKIATEIRALQKTEVNEVAEPFAQKQKGSSAMPHKKNPIKSEQICGIARVIRAAVTPALENISLWHERDISHSSVERVILPDTCIALDYILSRLNWILDGLQVNVDNMRKNIDFTEGLVYSQRLMLRLINSGVSRDKAHTMVQGKVMSTIKRGGSFREEVVKDGEIRRYLTLEEIEAMFDLDIYIRHVDSIFKRVLG
ncbi:adenylosuccinate lyase [bacterium]|nr:adenylosuccinate lyase [bacterium]